MNCVAWIAGNDPTNNNAPRMPWLQAQALGFTNVNTYWKLQVTFHDTNGYPHRDFDSGDPNSSNSSPYLMTDPIVNPSLYTSNTPDVVTIHSNTNSPTYVSGWRLVTNGTWNIYQDPDWSNALSNGWFGGDATLSLMISNPTSGATILPPQNFYFRIARENPATNLCKAYINANDTNTNDGRVFWYAYAIAKYETKDEGGPGSRYNHFLNDGGRTQPKPGFEGVPDWGNDGTKYHQIGRLSTKRLTGTGGYGLFQLTRESRNDTNNTGSPAYIMPRSWIWNWQSNTMGFMHEIIRDDTQYVTNNGVVSNKAPAPRKYNTLLGMNPALASERWCPGIQATNNGAFTSYETLLIGVYNGSADFTTVKPPFIGNIQSPWKIKGTNWILTATYPPDVASELDTNTP